MPATTTTTTQEPEITRDTHTVSHTVTVKEWKTICCLRLCLVPTPTPISAQLSSSHLRLKRSLDGLQAKGGSSFSKVWLTKNQWQEGEGKWVGLAAARLGFCLASCQISMATPPTARRPFSGWLCEYLRQSDLCPKDWGNTFNEVEG